MKKSFLILSLVITTVLFLSCRNGLLGREKTNSTEETAYIYLNVNTAGRTAMLKEDSTRVDRLKRIVLIGRHNGESHTFIDTTDEETTFVELLEELNDEDKKIKIQTGSWSFTLSATLDDVPFSGSTAQVIKTGTNTLSFNLSPEESYSNHGGMSIGVNVIKPVDADEPVLEKVVATLKKESGIRKKQMILQSQVML